MPQDEVVNYILIGTYKHAIILYNGQIGMARGKIFLTHCMKAGLRSKCIVFSSSYHSLKQQ